MSKEGLFYCVSKGETREKVGGGEDVRVDNHTGGVFECGELYDDVVGVNNPLTLSM